MALAIHNLRAGLPEREILKGFSLEVPAGQVHAIMGKNGCGKSTLAKVLAGHSGYPVSEGSATLDGIDLFKLTPDERSRAGLFLAFQYPMDIPGVTIANFIRAARAARLPQGEEIDAVAYYRELYTCMDKLDIPRNFTARFVNDGMSGGEKKRCEVLQMTMLAPKYAILDETDSGLDIDALKIVSEGVNALRSPERGFLVITHYQRLLDYIVPDVVHIMAEGRIVFTGDKDLALKLEAAGYEGTLRDLS